MSPGHDDAAAWRFVGAVHGVSDPGTSLHSWRCEYPDRYGACECLDVLVEELTGVAGDG